MKAPELLRERDYYPTLEAELAARSLAWYHTHDSRRSAEGFPDYIVAGVGRWLVAAELKKYPHALTREQADWLLRLRGPWRASFAVEVGHLSSLLLAIDNMKAGRLDDRGPTGLSKVLVLGLVKGSALLGSEAAGEYVRPVDELAAATPATVPTRRTRCSPRRGRGW